MRRATCWMVVVSVSALLCGCGVGGGIEAGMPSDVDMTKISDPMAGVKTQAPLKAKPAKKATPR